MQYVPLRLHECYISLFLVSYVICMVIMLRKVCQGMVTSVGEQLFTMMDLARNHNVCVRFSLSSFYDISFYQAALRALGL